MTKDFPTFVCQSCATLVRHADEAGTNSRGQRDGSYCKRCYGNGRFIEPRLTLKEMIARVAEELRSRGMSSYTAGAELAEKIAGLERWRDRDSARKTSREIPTQKTPQLVVSRKSDTR